MLKRKTIKALALILSVVMVLGTALPSYAGTVDIDAPVSEEVLTEDTDMTEDAEATGGEVSGGEEKNPSSEKEIEDTGSKETDEETDEAEITDGEVLKDSEENTTENDTAEEADEEVEKDSEEEKEPEEEAPLFTSMGMGSSSIGNLWDGWDEYADDMYKPLGTGMEADPYLITDLANLMWLSVNTVKGTAGVAEAYYEMTNSIDMSALPSEYWHPIGWYRNDIEPSAVKPFKGHFNGCGYEISGLDLICGTYDLQYVGLFGVIDGGVIENLILSADTVAGYDYVGILAGKMCGDATAHYVTVSGTANAGISVSSCSDGAHVGGITGLAQGDALSASGAVVLEDCRAENVMLNAQGTSSAVGGIAGEADRAYIVDSYIDGTYVKGQGYTGGIVGTQIKTNIYNSYVDTTVGCSGSVAAGGVTGHFVSGQIYLVQMNGEIAATNRAVTHEGIVIGTRGTSTSFDYGANTNDECGYIFFNEALKGKAVSGSGIAGDASGYTKAAHIGYWNSSELKYTRMEGRKEYPCGDKDFYYEELESGIRHIVVQKLGKQFSVQDYASGLRFTLNHYAAGPTGAPVPGYLVSIPQINSVNSSDLDVAYFTALAGDGSLFYKVIDKTSAAAVAPGTIVTCVTSAKNDAANNRYFQRVVDELVEPEHVKRPTYTDSTLGYTEEYEMDYQSGGTYTFIMPECDTELGCEYEKVHSAIELNPQETTLFITATRTGDRKNPQITWRITDDNGHLLADEIVRNKKETDTTATGFIQSDSDVNPISIEAIFNSASADNKVKWTVDDATLINMDGTEAGFTEKRAKIKPEVMADKNAWLYGIVNKAETDQKNNNYVSAIDQVEYTKTAVLTATTDPDHSVDRLSAYARCNLKLSFKIIDNTTLWAEGVSLDKSELTFDIVRRVTGDRRNPSEVWEVTGLKDLKATVSPAESFVRSVTWEMTGAGATSLIKTASGEYDHDLAVESVFKGTAPESTLPDWMLALYSADNAAKTADKNYVMTGQGTRSAVITVTATDKQLRVHTATCQVTVNYRTIDTTPDVHRLDINTDNLAFTIQRSIYGYRGNPSESYSVTAPQKLSVALSDNARFLEDVIWTTDANISNTISSSYSGLYKSENLVSVSVDTSNIAAAPAWIYDVVNADNTAWNNNKSTKRTGSAQLSGYITVTSNDVTLPDGTAETKRVRITITFITSDTTTTSTGGGGGSSGGGGGGGGGGSSSSGTVGGGGGAGGPGSDTTDVKMQVSNPAAGAVLGHWTYNALTDKWTFEGNNGHKYLNEWAYIHNPDAAAGLPQYDWFYFNADMTMLEGWYVDPRDGQTYYLSPVKDSRRGHMVVGYQYIDGAWYYFSTGTDGIGKRGSLIRNSKTPAGETTDKNGRILINGKVITNPAAFTVTLQ